MTEVCFYCTDKFESCKCGEAEGWSDEGAVCPYCGHVDLAKNSEGYLYNEASETNSCVRCGKDYKMELHVSHSWSTERI